jgi:hypothetical protein
VVHLFRGVGTGHGDGSVLGEDLTVKQGFVVRDAGLAALQVKCPEVGLLDEQLEGNQGPHSEL